MQLSDFEYILPTRLIAQKPASPRDHSMLMVLKKNKIEQKHFYDIVDYLKEGDVLVLNETKVIPAKIVGKKETGAKAELIIENIDKNECRCIIKTRNPKPGNKLIFKNCTAEVLSQHEPYFKVRFDKEVNEIIQDIGTLPLPPYIKKELDKDSQYQTVYSRKKGSVAAPTAGLHFTASLLKKIEKKGVRIAKICLHVDFGTFLPVRDISKNKLHEEYFEIDKETADAINKRKGRLFVVGTTSVRALESANENGKIIPKTGKTELFIKPGYQFKTKIDALITNFHLPKSTLLMLVSAFAGRDNILNAYKIAVEQKYRFFSFGDAMLIFN